VESIVMASIALSFSLVSLILVGIRLRMQRTQRLRGPELHVQFDRDEDLLVLQNIGSEALEMSVDMFVDPADDDRYPDGSTPVWRFRRVLQPSIPKRFMNPSLSFLTEMGYRQDCTFIIRFRGSFWPTAAGKSYSRRYEQDYKAVPTDSGWLYVEISNRDWFYADHKGEFQLSRAGIPVGLRKEDGHS